MTGGERGVAGAGRRTHFQYAYARSADQDRAAPAEHPVVVVGAGPVGLTAALDLASRGVPVVLLDDADRIGEGSRGICYAKRSLEIWDRLGIGERIRDSGVTWKVGRVFRGERELFSFDLLPEDGHKMPAFINLQQYHLEKTLIDRVAQVPAINLRWKNRVTGLAPRNDGATLTVETPDGLYRIEAQWVIAADGARSTLRDLLGLGFAGVSFEDKFLIADIRMRADLLSERHFWFDPPFHAGHHVLMHRQPDDVWRIDFQLGAEADPVAEASPERVMPRLKRMLGDRDFTLEWASVYQFHCRRLDRFVHGRVIFAGDAAHQVAPFGARGGNSGVQDAENIAWKLAALLGGEGGPHLIDSYDAERAAAADENIAHSTAATEFIAPADPSELVLRDAVLALAPRAEFARRMVNSGRLSTATVYRGSPLSTPDEDRFGGIARLGGPLPDAPVVRRDDRPGFLLEQLGGGFTLLRMAGGEAPAVPAGMDVLTVGEDFGDPTGLIAARLDLEPGTALLLRPDQHLCARWRRPGPERVAAAHARARGFAN